MPKISNSPDESQPGSRPRVATLDLEVPITMAEAAKLLGIHYKTLSRYVLQGKLVAVVYGTREKRILPSDLQAFINASRKIVNSSEKTYTKSCTESVPPQGPKNRVKPCRIAPKGAKPADSQQEVKWYEKYR